MMDERKRIFVDLDHIEYEENIYTGITLDLYGRYGEKWKVEENIKLLKEIGIHVKWNQTPLISSIKFLKNQLEDYKGEIIVHRDVDETDYWITTWISKYKVKNDCIIK